MLQIGLIINQPWNTYPLTPGYYRSVGPMCVVESCAILTILMIHSQVRGSVHAPSITKGKGNTMLHVLGKNNIKNMIFIHTPFTPYLPVDIKKPSVGA